MKSLVVHMESTKTPKSGNQGRAVVMIVMLALASIVGSSVEVRAETGKVTTVQDDSMKQLAGEALGYSVMASDSRERRVTLGLLGVVGMHLGSSSLVPRTRRRRVVRRLGYRVGLPLLGAALGNLVACNGPSLRLPTTAEPMIGSLAGSLAGHVLDPPSSSWASSRDDVLISAWTPTITILPGMVSAGINGRF